MTWVSSSDIYSIINKNAFFLLQTIHMQPSLWISITIFEKNIDNLKIKAT